MQVHLNVALIGNPNTGKTSVFNKLTGLNQKVGNYPGVTVEKREGTCRLHDSSKVRVTDLPGTYSLNATSADEQIVVNHLFHQNGSNNTDVAVVVADVENLKRNLLLFTQIKDLNIPVILAVNMTDVMKRKGISIDISKMEKMLQTKIALISTRKNTGIEHLKQLILDYKQLSLKPCTSFSEIDPDYFQKLKKTFPKNNLYKSWLGITQGIDNENTVLKNVNGTRVNGKSIAELKRMQQKETILRYLFINKLLKAGYQKDITVAKDFRSRPDRILTHRFLG